MYQPEPKCRRERCSALILLYCSFFEKKRKETGRAAIFSLNHGDWIRSNPLAASPGEVATQAPS